MVCDNCKENIERTRLGYSAKDLPCNCSRLESFFWNIKQGFVLGLIVIPITLFMVLVFLPVTIMEKTNKWLSG
jgi:hypothetical protein